jgi:hypothetical protein
MPLINNQNIYNRSLELLRDFKHEAGSNYKGRFSQIFLALKYYQNELPSIYSGRYINTGVLQTMIDELYNKSSRSLNSSVISLFNNSYLPRTGVVPEGGSSPGNNWRNNFNIQKGIGCYAPSSYLSSNTFLNESRIDCRFIDISEDGTLRGARCSLCSTGAGYRSENHRKWLQISQDGSGYSVLDLLNTSNFQPYVAPNSNRIPILPLIFAIYFDSNPGLLIGSRAEENISISTFMSDFNFSVQEFKAYFDDSPTNKFNEILLTEFTDLSLSNHNNNTLENESVAVSEKIISLDPILDGTLSTPPNTHSGWEAEQFVIETLSVNGWEVFDVSRQSLGYDILAKKGKRTIFIEAKSSLGRCTPSLTSREWQQSRALGENYILAVIENFDPLGELENVIHFVPNPALLSGISESTTTKYSIPRASWISNVVLLNDI